jgi:methyl-accepting chemotaxis protein
MRLTIKQKLYSIAAGISLTIVVIIAVMFNSLAHVNTLGHVSYELAEARADMLMLRRNEKDFLSRQDLKYVKVFEENIGVLRAHLDLLEQDLVDESLDTQRVEEFWAGVQEYQDKFNAIVTLEQKIGLTPTSGLYGELRAAIHAVEESLKGANEQKILKDMLMLRRHEKDFMLRVDMKYQKKFDKDLNVMINNLNQTALNTTETENINRSLQLYKTKFDELVKNYQIKGLNSKEGLMGEMRAAIHGSEKSLELLQSEIPLAIEQAQDVITRNILLIAAFLSVMIIGVVIYLANAISSTISQVNREILQISSEGDLSRRIEEIGNDELTSVATCMNKLLSEFQQLIATVRSSTQLLDTAASELEGSARITEEEMSKQHLETEQAGTAMNEMSATVQEVATSTNSAAEQAANAESLATEGQHIVQEASTTINRLSEILGDGSDVIAKLESETNSIGSILDVIRDIADQTNLLALNAAIEAARAGEYGRGFAVVADEVRGLASRTQKSTQEIQKKIETLQEEAAEAVLVMTKGQEHGTSGVQQINRVSESLAQMVQSVTLINDMNTQIATAAEEQSAVASEIDKNITLIRDSSHNVSGHAQDTVKQSLKVSELTDALNRQIERFKA